MKSNEINPRTSISKRLLTLAEEIYCRQIASETQSNSGRARALLSLNNGSTQAEAASRAGLTIGQVKYVLSRFRKLRLGIFPDFKAGETIIEKESSETTKPTMEPKETSKRKKRNKKGKKNSVKNKVIKKDKNMKKGKKGKKSKKDTKGKKGKNLGKKGKGKKPNKSKKKGKKSKKK